MLRFAPSPTGDMHIGNLRTALFNYIVAIQKKEKLLIRIEDTDEARNIEGKDKDILNILNIFDIKYDEVLYQSSNLQFHTKLASKLLIEKNAFCCFCSQEVLEEKKEKAKKLKRAYRYDGACLNLSDNEVLNNEKNFSIRFKKPNENIHFEDYVKNKGEFKPAEIDNFIILKENKKPTYNFACGIDDMLADISLVIRGEDHFSNTAKQIALRKALNYDKEIMYAHLPMILNENGKKMSKRDDASSVSWLLEEGFLPSAISNYLVLLGFKAVKEIFTLQEALKFFDIKSISKAPAKFDINKLKFINKEHMKLLKDEELALKISYKSENIGKLAKLYLEEAHTLKELKPKIDKIFSKKESDNENVLLLKKFIDIKNIQDDFNLFKKDLMTKSSLKGKDFFKALRFVLTGENSGPDLSKIYPLIKHMLGDIVR